MNTTSPFRLALVLSVIVGGVLVTRLAAQAPTQQAPVFRTRTELIEIDVVVVDRNGEKVHGLTRDDFILKDRKQPQSIETFTEVEREAERAVEVAPLPPDTRVDVAVNTAAKAGRLVVLVLDDLHVFRGRADTVKEIARKIVQDLGPESAMALIQTGGEHSVEVTDDRTRLLEAVEQFKGRRPTRRPLQACDPVAHSVFADPDNASAFDLDPGCDIQTVNANAQLYKSLEDAARILGGGDTRRKAFILVSEHVAKDISGIFGGGTQIPDPPPDGTGYAGGGGVEALSRPGGVPAHDYALLDMMNAMRRGNVATYSIDPRGEITPQEMMQECQPATGFSGIRGDPCEGAGGVQDWTSWVRQAQHGLEIVSEETGGFAVVNTDDFTSGIASIISDLDNYYLLGFYPEDLTSKGYRKIEVEVKGRPDLTLRYRQGYQLEGAPPPPKETDELSRLIGGALPVNDLPLRLHAVPMPYSSKESKVAVALELTVPTRSMQDGESERLLDDIQYGLYAIDLKGAKVRERKGSGAKIALRPRPGLATVPDQVTYEIVSELRLQPGRYQLRASATSEKLDAGGSVYLSFEVPDFSKETLTLTDLVIAYADGPHVPIARDGAQSAAPASSTRMMARGRPAPTLPPLQVNPILPFDPTLDREFRPTDTLRLYFKAIQRGSAMLTATVTALHADGTVAATFDRELGSNVAPELDIKLPLAQLTPGAYTLRVTVRDGTRDATREIGFRVK